MTRLRLVTGIAAFTFGAALLADSPQPQSALFLLDSYLAQAAPSVPSYRTDLQPGGDPQHLPPGRFFAIGPMIGPFTYRAKHYEELTKDERGEVLRDPRFRAFLIATRTQEDRPSPRESQPRALRLGPERFSISPEEMLRERPILIVIARP